MTGAEIIRQCEPGIRAILANDPSKMEQELRFLRLIAAVRDDPVPRELKVVQPRRSAWRRLLDWFA